MFQTLWLCHSALFRDTLDWDIPPPPVATPFLGFIKPGLPLTGGRGMLNRVEQPGPGSRLVGPGLHSLEYMPRDEHRRSVEAANGKPGAAPFPKPLPRGMKELRKMRHCSI